MRRRLGACSRNSGCRRLLRFPIPLRVAKTPLGRLIHRVVVGRVFHRYLEIVPADTDELRDEVFRIRYNVYCQELKWENPAAFPEGLEQDAYDRHSLHCLMLHKPSRAYVGCVRLVRVDAQRPDAPLPFEVTCEGRLFPEVFQGVDRLRIGEISRLAVRAQFRRRAGEHNVAEGVIPEPGGPRGARRTPPIAMGLYLAAAASGLLTGLDAVFALMEPRLARRLRTYGLVFQEAGAPVEHRGLRVPFYITRAALDVHISPVVRGFLDMLLHDLRAARGWDVVSSNGTPVE